MTSERKRGAAQHVRKELLLALVIFVIGGIFGWCVHELNKPRPVDCYYRPVHSSPHYYRPTYRRTDVI